MNEALMKRIRCLKFRSFTQNIFAQIQSNFKMQKPRNVLLHWKIFSFVFDNVVHFLLLRTTTIQGMSQVTKLGNMLTNDTYQVFVVLYVVFLSDHVMSDNDYLGVIYCLLRHPQCIKKNRKLLKRLIFLICNSISTQIDTTVLKLDFTYKSDD